jgi:glycosyltransferase involved in cell wall biosynthesis
LNVIFYVEQDWAFGRIHTDLSKYLFQYGINAHFLDWTKIYQRDEIYHLNKIFDAWVTTPHGWKGLSSYDVGVEPEKMIVVSHSKLDIHEPYDALKDMYSRFYSYGAVSNWIIEESKNKGIEREPILCPLGIDYKTFKLDISRKLERIGFASSFNRRNEICRGHDAAEKAFGMRVKRGYLAEDIAERTDLELKIAKQHSSNFATMPAFYKSVDSILITSTHEGAGLPMLEAGAAGKLVMSTSVGHFEERVGDKGAIRLPMGETELVDYATDVLNFYKRNSHIYMNKCFQIQEHAESYDWKYVIKNWLKLFTRE